MLVALLLRLDPRLPFDEAPRARGEARKQLAVAPGALDRVHGCSETHTLPAAECKLRSGHSVRTKDTTPVRYTYKKPARDPFRKESQWTSLRPLGGHQRPPYPQFNGGEARQVCGWAVHGWDERQVGDNDLNPGLSSSASHKKP